MPKQLELAQRKRIIRLERPDVIVFQSARNKWNRPQYYPGETCILDLDDADFLAPGWKNGTLECLEESAGVIAGSQFVADFARQYNERVETIWTSSTPTHDLPRQKAVPPVVAYAPMDASGYPRECELVMSALHQMPRRDYQFWLFGVGDPSFGQSLTGDLQSRGISCRTFPFMKYRDFLKMMGEVSIGLAPIVSSNEPLIIGKSFGKVLSYLNGHAAVVASKFADHEKFFEDGVNGFLASTAEEFSVCIDRLLSDQDLRRRLTERAYLDYAEKLSTHVAVEKTDMFMRSVINSVTRQ